MYKYKKIVSPLLMIILTLAIFVIIVSAIFFHISNLNTIRNKIVDINYYEKVEKQISISLKNYMSDENINNLLKDGRIKKDVDNLILAIENNIIHEQEKAIKADLEQDILSLLANLDVDANNYSNKISNIYYTNLLPVNELEVINNLFGKFSQAMTFWVIIASVCMILCIMYLGGSGKQKKWLFVSIYNSIIFCAILILVVSNFTNIYYLNDIITELIQSIISLIIRDIVIIVFILLILVIIFNYIEYFKKVKKH